ncbi:MAG: class D sortase [Clostridiales bacterium]|nr:class D sortase [Clostridiales bacterium]
MTKNRGSESKQKNYSIARKIGITFIIPIFLAIIGGVLVLSAGWNYITSGLDFATLVFAKPQVNLEKKEIEIDNQKTTKPNTGDEIGTLSIDSVAMNVTVYQGDYEEQFKLGAGHNELSALPGQKGKVVLASHRDGYFAPLEFVKEGDEVVLSTSYGKYIYKISKIWVADPKDMTVTAPVDREMLVMYTCYPFHVLGHAPNRYIVECEFDRCER